MTLDDVHPVPAEVTSATDIIGVGGAITADSVLASYLQGVFPMAVQATDLDGTQFLVTSWFAPARRAVLRWPGMHISRSLRRSMRRFRCSFDEDFVGVLDGCADPDREHGWIDEAYRGAYLELFARGRAHSVEVWSASDLVGGLIGVDMGGVFCADSKFHRVRDASKAAVAALSARVFAAPNAQERLIDAQWLTPHLASLGFQEVDRSRYTASLARLVSLPSVFNGSRTR